MKEIFLALLLALCGNEAYATIAIDGTPATGNTIVSNHIAVTLSNTQTNDIIYLCTRADNTASTISGIADLPGALTWTLRKREVPGSPDYTGECWYAKSTGVLTSDVITVTWTSTPAFARVLAFSVSGADFTTPFDTNASIPAGGLTTGNVTTIAANSISTSNSNDMLIGSLTATGGISAVNEPSGFSQVASTGVAAFDVSTKVVSTQQASATFTWTWTTGSPANIIFDAVRQSPPAITPNLLLDSAF